MYISIRCRCLPVNVLHTPYYCIYKYTFYIFLNIIVIIFMFCYIPNESRPRGIAETYRSGHGGIEGEPMQEDQKTGETNIKDALATLGIDSLTIKKTCALIEGQAATVCGLMLLLPSGEKAVVEFGALRWLSKDAAWALMHPGPGQ